MCCMSLCALIYSKITRITSVDEMIQIMTVGNQLYSSLSLLARQSMFSRRGTHVIFVWSWLGPGTDTSISLANQV